jgi:hypothetical protein
VNTIDARGRPLQASYGLCCDSGICHFSLDTVTTHGITDFIIEKKKLIEVTFAVVEMSAASGLAQVLDLPLNPREVYFHFCVNVSKSIIILIAIIIINYYDYYCL